MTCEFCRKTKECISAVANGDYYATICRDCLSALSGGSDVSSGTASFDRRRQYEDNAQDTIQPYDASGKPNKEFFRLYPSAAQKTFTGNELEQVKRQL